MQKRSDLGILYPTKLSFLGFPYSHADSRMSQVECSRPVLKGKGLENIFCLQRDK
jgi:hypothetical protein